MKKYNGTKTVIAEPMAKSEAEKVLKRSLADAKGGEDGYFIKYPDGYKSWSPKETFEKAYKLVEHENKCCDPDFLVRMRDEYNELCERYIKLVSFMFAPENIGMDENERDLLHQQAFSMEQYLRVLGQRINRAWKKRVRVAMATSKLVGKVVRGVNMRCDGCEYCDPDHECVKLDVPGIGNLCLEDNSILLPEHNHNSQTHNISFSGNE